MTPKIPEDWWTPVEGSKVAMPANGKFAIITPNPIGRSSYDYIFFLIARYIKKKATPNITKFSQLRL